MGVIRQFKEFIFRGNVLDLAIGVIIGAAFSGIVTSLIGDVITPLLLKPAFDFFKVNKLEDLSWNGVLFGKFISATLSFLITAFILFLMIKAINKMRKKKEEAPAPPAEPTKDQVLLTEIRDLLKKE